LSEGRIGKTNSSAVTESVVGAVSVVELEDAFAAGGGVIFAFDTTTVKFRCGRSWRGEPSLLNTYFWLWVVEDRVALDPNGSR
jgi:hypothetical protein